MPAMNGTHPHRPSRRHFLVGASGSLLAAAMPGRSGPWLAREDDEHPGAVKRPDDDGSPVRRSERLIVSTWSFGVAANEAAWRALTAGVEHPVHACEGGVKVVEADPTTSSVGYGGRPNAEGEVELDAAVMRGDTLACGAVAGLRRIKHPVSVARHVMERTDHVLLVGEGALAFARANGHPEEDLLTPESRAAWERWKQRQGASSPADRPAWPALAAAPGEDHDTIGMIVLDRGRLGTAVTTSGMAYKLPGRVGDSPIIGAGSACDDEVGAVVSTGVGEEVIRTGGSQSILEAMRRGVTPRRAVREVLGRLNRLHRRLERRASVAYMVISRGGEVYGGANHQGFEYAFTDDSGTRLIAGEIVA
jgi:N4-(beta-N-acetylglucosaminyl)-L-asparaginase